MNLHDVLSGECYGVEDHDGSGGGCWRSGRSGGEGGGSFGERGRVGEERVFR